MSKQPRLPASPAEWQKVVDLAEMCLRLDSARQYGLITGGPGVHVNRCLDLLARGQAVGVRPTEAGVEAALQAFLRDQAPDQPDNALQRVGGGDRR